MAGQPRTSREITNSFRLLAASRIFLLPLLLRLLLLLLRRFL
jgi:hypothetical protein